jgi:hypothetical protein
MIRKLFYSTALVAVLGVTMSTPAPAIELACSCTLCTNSTSTLYCRDYYHGPLNTWSCGQYHSLYCN